MRLSRLLFGSIVLLTPLVTSLHPRYACAAGPEFLPPTSQLSDQRARMDPLLVSEKISKRSWSEKGAIAHILPPLERFQTIFSGRGIQGLELPLLSTKFAGKFAGLNDNKEFVFFTIKPKLQSDLEQIISAVRAPHVAAVIMEPETGKVLALAGRSSSVENIEVHSHFPAASLFKIVTAAAAIEEANISSDTVVRFRGGDYTLNKWNYYPKKSRDNRSMSVGLAMGKSCNPVFGRLALNHVGSQKLRKYAKSFGFNQSLTLDIPLTESTASIPSNSYELSRTGAGFGDVTISPIHAAALVAGVTQSGKMPQPTLIDKIISPEGKVLFRNESSPLRQMVSKETANELVAMMKNTTISGTSSKQFRQGRYPLFPNLSIAAKTGTLRGKNPNGLNTWFIAAAPAEAPRYALSVVVVDPQTSSSRASYVGRQIFEKLFPK